MIIKKIINGVVLGYNTEKRSYCELPKVFVEPSQINEKSEVTDEEYLEMLKAMSAEELKKYAEDNNITIPGNVSKGAFQKPPRYVIM